MKLLDQLHFTPAEQKKLSNFLKLSLFLCAVTAFGFWFYQRLQANKSTAQEGDILSAALQSGSVNLLPIDIEAHEWAANYYLRVDNPQKAIDHLLRILPYKRSDRGAALQLATAYIQAQQYENAHRLLRELSDQKAQDQYTDSIEARFGLALMYLGKSSEARSQLEKCLANGRRSAEAACYLGQVMAMFSSPSDTAEQFLLKAIDWEPGYVEAWYQLARYYMSVGKYEKSRTHLLQVLEMQPLYEKAHSRLGMAYYYLNQPDLAEKEYQTALALNPGDYNTRYNLGELYYTLYNDPRRAAEEFTQTLAVDSLHVDANFKMGLISLSNIQVSEAIGFFEQARRASPRNTRILLQLGVAYEKASKKDLALQVYDFIKGYDPLNEIASQKIKLLRGQSIPGSYPAAKKHGEKDSPSSDPNEEFYGEEAPPAKSAH